MFEKLKGMSDQTILILGFAVIFLCPVAVFLLNLFIPLPGWFWFSLQIICIVAGLLLILLAVSKKLAREKNEREV